MNHNATDMITHTQNPINQVKKIKGVILFDQSRAKPNFIMAAYDAAQSHALAIFNKLTRVGFNASLVNI